MSTNSYVELHCHSNYSFQEGASSIDELVARAKDLNYPALALTDHDNLCGAMEFSRIGNSIGVKPITGAEITLKDGSHLTLLVETKTGYSNLCNLVTFSRTGIDGNRLDPRLDPRLLSNHSEGLILLTGCPNGRVPHLITEGRTNDAEATLRRYLKWFGSDNVFVELQQNLVRGDTQRIKQLVHLARKLNVRIVATNNAHYHVPRRHKLQDALVAIQHNKTLEESHLERRPNSNFYLKSPKDMSVLFENVPDAIHNSTGIAKRCTFNLTEDLEYQFPDYPAPDGYTSYEYLKKICYETAVRRYGQLMPHVLNRLEEEFRLIRKHDLSGFFLIYHEITLIARDIMIDLGLSSSEIPLEERPPGRGRGSSVAMLIGYLIGLSHIDPLKYNLSLERFINDEMGEVPDIDLDFPRNVREELIKRVHQKWGWNHVALTGMISTYRIKSCIRDLGKSLGLPAEDVNKLAKSIDVRHANTLKSEMSLIPNFRSRVNAPGWRDLIYLAPQLEGFPKYLAQHPGGMIIASSPLVDIVPVQPGAIKDRYICHWDKDSIADAGFIKIDFLSLGVLSQMQEALQLVEIQKGNQIDLGRINFDDDRVYESLHQADTIGVFQVESAAQMQTITRIKPRNLVEMAFEIAAVRPGVGINSGINQFIERHRYGIPWEYDHPLEKPALERTLGIVLFQDQVNQIAIHVAGFSPKEANELRRAFSRNNNESLLKMYRKKFMIQAAMRGVSMPVAERIFKKFSGEYMFPESHAYAFGITAYQMAWMKFYHPLEFYVAIFNQQPMGFYNLETLKEDAKRHGIDVLNPDINESDTKCTVKNSALLLGFLNVKGLGTSRAQAIVESRENKGPFCNLSDLIYRTGLQHNVLENMVASGVLDSLIPERRDALWQVGLICRPINTQQVLPLPFEQDLADLPPLTEWEAMLGEYRSMGIHPKEHFVGQIRSHLDPAILYSSKIRCLKDGANVTVAGLVVRRQQPNNSKATFITLEDEFGHISIVVWPNVFIRYRFIIKKPVLIIRGTVSRRHGTLNIIAEHVKGMDSTHILPPAKNWT